MDNQKMNTADGMEQTVPETPAEPIVDMPIAGGEVPIPDLTADEAVALAWNSEVALRDIDGEQLEPPTPFKMGDDHIPRP